jgi:diaminopimelate decarboxylase
LNSFTYRDADLCCDGVRLADIAGAVGTPAYVYSESAIRQRYAELDGALASVPHRVCYAVKTNSNLAVLGALARLGAGFDIVSAGELDRLRRVRAPAERVVFAGVGKTRDEMQAALVAGIDLFNVESVPEAEALASVAAALGRRAPVALRVNPDVVAGGHRYVSTGTRGEKFGIPWADAVALYERLAADPALQLRGLHCHVGSQILALDTFHDAAARLAKLARAIRVRGLEIDTVNLGGGLGIRYHAEEPPAAEQLAAAIAPPFRGLDVRLLLEPGRSLVGNAGVLLARVLYVKENGRKTFVIVDAGMNDLVRPSLYGAHHEILPITRRADREAHPVDVVGPLCEAGDFLARDRILPLPAPGDLLAVCAAGAYGFCMSSNYNSRRRAAEVLVRDGAFRCVRDRESLDDLVRGERDWPPGSDPPGSGLSFAGSA